MVSGVGPGGVGAGGVGSSAESQKGGRTRRRRRGGIDLREARRLFEERRRGGPAQPEAEPEGPDPEQQTLAERISGAREKEPAAGPEEVRQSLILASLLEDQNGRLGDSRSRSRRRTGRSSLLLG